MNLLQIELRRLIEVALADALGTPRHICLIDPPGHPNVGDCAILLGELDYLARTHPNARISFYDVNSYADRAIEQISRADVLLIHGGGNFGDIWLHHHNLRMWLFKNFSGKKIIQLPQSIHFSDQAMLADAAAAIAMQSDFTLFTRDRRSFEFATKNFDCKIHLIPDMAFAMNPLSRRAADSDCFCLLRTDKEAVADHAAIQNVIRQTGRKVEVDDWLNESQSFTMRSNRFVGRVVKKMPAAMAPFAGSLLALRRRYAKDRLAAGVELLSRGRIVVADRLHAHILCCLLDIPSVVFDSYDGKISAFYETWTHKMGTARVCAEIAELPNLLNEIDPANG